MPAKYDGFMKICLRHFHCFKKKKLKMHTGVQFNGVLSPCWQVKLTQILEYEIS
jgi:hypothetical protein